MTVATYPKWTKADRLWPEVPWLWPSDCAPGPRCAWELEFVGDMERLSCWPVAMYDREGGTQVYLLLHAMRGNGNDGGAITLSISEAPQYGRYAQEALRGGRHTSDDDAA